MSWATNHDASLEGLQRVQGSLTVDLIMVPRSSLRTCTSRETAAQVKARNEDQFSYFPVVDEVDRVVGLYHAERWFDADAPDTAIGDDFERLSEAIVIGADASIFEFVMQADTNPTNLVVSGNQIAGLVSLSDLQQLPVRAALFALITSLEMAMARRIAGRWRDEPSGWIGLLEDPARKALEKKVRRAKKEDSFVDPVILTQFSDKSKIVVRGGILDELKGDEETVLDNIRVLRNNLAHGNQYAETPEKALEVCHLVRKTIEIKGLLAQ